MVALTQPAAARPEPTAARPEVAGRTLGAFALATLGARGWCVVPEWLPPPAVSAVLSDALALDRAGVSRQAGVGSRSANSVNAEVRRSRLCTLYPPPPPAAGCIDTRIALCGAIQELRMQLQSCAALAPPTLHPFQTELSYLYYPEGGFFRRHLDVPASNAGWHLRGRPRRADGARVAFGVRRFYSFILYLDAPWRAEWGGALRVFEGESGAAGGAADDFGSTSAEEGAEEGFTDVVPHGGSLVILRSDRVEHEVLETRRPRNCVVGWFCTEGDVETDDE